MEEAEEAASRNNSRILHHAGSELTGMRCTADMLVKDWHDKAVSTEAERNQRWMEHLQEVRNQDTQNTLHDFNRESQLKRALQVFEDVITSQETWKTWKTEEEVVWMSYLRSYSGSVRLVWFQR